MTLVGNIAAEQRLDWLRQRLDQSGQVLIRDAAAELDVSEMTVRRDLLELEGLGVARRVRGGAVDFTTLALTPRPFLGVNGFQYDFEHLDSDEVRRKGRVVGAVIDGRLYLILFDAAKSHYYNALLPDFEAITSSARRV